MNSKFSRFFMLSFIAVTACVFPSSAFATDDLQEYIDKITKNVVSTRSAEEPTIVDLSQFTATTRNKTLSVSNGISIKFTNGTLKRKEDLKEPLVTIKDGSSVEIGEGATIADDDYYLMHEIISVNNGTLKISSGQINAKKDIPAILYSASDHFIMTGGQVTNGEVSCYEEGTEVKITGGNAAINSYADVYIGDDANVSVTLKSKAVVHIIEALKNNITIIKSTVTVGDIIAKSENYQIQRSDWKKVTLNAVSYKDPTTGITEKGVNGFLQAPTLLKNSNIVVSKRNEVASEDDLQDFLDQLAKEGKSTEENPDTIRIADEGIMVKHIIIPKTGYFVLTGGKITLQEYDHCNFYVNGHVTFKNITIDLCQITGTSGRLSHYFYLFDSSSVIISTGVTFTGIQDTSVTGLCSFEGGGTFKYYSGTFISQGTIISGNGGTFHLCGGKLESHSTVINGNQTYVWIIGGEITGHSSTVIYTTGIFHITGGTVIGKSSDSILVNALCAYYYGGSFIGNNYVFYVRGEIILQPGAYKHDFWFTVEKDSHIMIQSALLQKIYISAKWTSFELEKWLIRGEGYVLTKEDFENIEFIDLPENVEAYYDNKDHTVKLRKLPENSDDLQDFLDSLGGEGEKGTELEPLPVPICGCGVTIPQPINVPDDLQAFIDGQKKDGTSTEISFTGGDYIVPKTSSFRFSNIHFTGMQTESYFRISGKLFIENNISIYNFKRFIHLYNGGTIIWRSIHDAEATSEVIYNEGGRIEINWGSFTGGIRNGGDIYFGGDCFTGNIYHLKGGRIYIKSLLGCTTRQININIHISVNEIEVNTPIIIGCNGYTLTEEDLKYITFILPEGYEWQLVNGTIIIRLTSGISNITDDNPTTVKGYYDAAGNRLDMPRKGVNVIRMNDGSVKKVVVD